MVEQAEIPLTGDFARLSDVAFLGSDGCCRPRVVVIGDFSAEVPLEELPWWGNTHHVQGKAVVYEVMPSGSPTLLRVAVIPLAETFRTTWSTMATSVIADTPGEAYRVAGLASGGFVIEMIGAGKGCGPAGCSDDLFRTYDQLLVHDASYARRFVASGRTPYLTSMDIAGLGGAPGDGLAWSWRGVAGGPGSVVRYDVDWASAQLIDRAEVTGGSAFGVNCYYKNNIAPLARVADHVVGGGAVTINDTSHGCSVPADFTPGELHCDRGWGCGGTGPISEPIGLGSEDGSVHVLLRRDGPAHDLYRLHPDSGAYEARDFSFSWAGEPWTAMRSDGDALVRGAVVSGAHSSAVLTAGGADSTLLAENLRSRSLAATGGTVTGDMLGTFAMARLDVSTITTGAHAGQGFSTGDWTAVLGGTTFAGSWRGMVSGGTGGELRLMGLTEGDVNGVIEGRLRESVPGSGALDALAATWRLTRVAGQPTTARLQLSAGATLTDDAVASAVAMTSWQGTLAGTATGPHAGPLQVVVTRVDVTDAASPHRGEGFSVLSFVSSAGTSQGWAHDRVIGSESVEMAGLTSGAIEGALCLVMPPAGAEAQAFVSVERLDVAQPPRADLHVQTWGPTRASPGETFNLVMEYRNLGLLPAEDMSIVLAPSFLVDFEGGSPGGAFDGARHAWRYDLPSVAPFASGLLSVQVRALDGLPGHAMPQSVAAAMPREPVLRDVAVTTVGPRAGRARLGTRGGTFSGLQGLPLETRLAAESMRQALRCSDEGRAMVQLEAQARFYAMLRQMLDVMHRMKMSTIQNMRGARAEANDAGPRTPEECYYAELEDDLARATLHGLPAALLARPGVATVSGSGFLGSADWILTVLTEQATLDIVKSSGYASDYVVGASDAQPYLKQEFLLCVTGEVAVETCPSAWSPCIGLPPAEIDACWSFVGPHWDGEIVTDVAVSDVDPVTHAYTLTATLSLWQGGGVSASRSVTARIATLEDADRFTEGFGAAAVEFVQQRFPPTDWLADAGKTLADLIREAKEACGVTPCPPDGDGPRSPASGRGAVGESENDASCFTCDPEWTTEIITAHDPNAKSGPDGEVAAGERLQYSIEYENEGEGTAFRVYVVDRLDADLDDATLEMGAVVSPVDGSLIAPAGTYDPPTRTLRWQCGAVGPGGRGRMDLAVRVRSDAPPGTEIINTATVHFPSVPEETRTNAVVSRTPPPDTDGDGIPDMSDRCRDVADPGQADADGDGIGDACDPCTDTDGDGARDPGFPGTGCPPDNCPTEWNVLQADADADGVGDACDDCEDPDGDGRAWAGLPGMTCPPDNCPGHANPGQEDGDADGLGDACDPCPLIHPGHPPSVLDCNQACPWGDVYSAATGGCDGDGALDLLDYAWARHVAMGWQGLEPCEHDVRCGDLHPGESRCAGLWPQPWCVTPEEPSSRRFDLGDSGVLRSLLLGWSQASCAECAAAAPRSATSPWIPGDLTRPGAYDGRVTTADLVTLLAGIASPTLLDAQQSLRGDLAPYGATEGAAVIAGNGVLDGDDVSALREIAMGRLHADWPLRTLVVDVADATPAAAGVALGIRAVPDGLVLSGFASPACDEGERAGLEGGMLSQACSVPGQPFAGPGELARLDIHGPALLASDPAASLVVEVHGADLEGRRLLRIPATLRWASAP